MLAAADTGPLLWAGVASESSPIAETVEVAYISGLRAAGEVRIARFVRASVSDACLFNGWHRYYQMGVIATGSSADPATIARGRLSAATRRET